jgi:hypothetical protein
MRRHFSGLALSLLLLGVGAMPAWACINDREVNTKEREFKSYYQDDAPHYVPEPSESTSPRQQLLSFAAVGAGSVMLTGACVFCLKRK